MNTMRSNGPSEPNTNTIEPTLTKNPEMAKSNGQYGARSVSRPLQLDLGLSQNGNEPSQAESLYLTLFDACHSQIEELEGIDQQTESEKYFACIDQIHHLQDTQSDIVRSLFVHYSELLNAHSGANQLLLEKDETKRLLEKDLDFTRSLALAQADLIGQLKLQNSNSEKTQAKKEGQSNE